MLGHIRKYHTEQNFRQFSSRYSRNLFCINFWQARLVYVNYAMVEDFQELREMNISVKGQIVIAKYGKIYRGDKVSIIDQIGQVMFTYNHLNKALEDLFQTGCRVDYKPGPAI